MFDEENKSDRTKVDRIVLLYIALPCIVIGLIDFIVTILS